MKKIKIILLLLMIAFALLSCSALEKEPIFLFSVGDGSALTSHEGFTLANEHGINATEIEKEFSELKGQKIDAGKYKGLEYKYSYVIEASAESNKRNWIYSIYDKYELRTDDELIYVECLHGTDRIVFYSSSEDMRDDQPAVSREQLRKIAEDFIISEVGEDLLEKYTFTSVDALPTGTAYGVHYQRYVAGYYTDEDIEIYMTPSGNIWAYRFDNIEKYDKVSTKLTKKKLDNAYELLEEKVKGLNLEEMELYKPCIVTDAEGKVYLEMKVDYTNESYSTCSLFYISVD